MGGLVGEAVYKGPVKEAGKKAGIDQRKKRRTTKETEGVLMREIVILNFGTTLGKKKRAPTH
ncbi:hypothetical protein HX99_04060 [Peptococcaceae bacterium SCADC1_2_3]|jgi:hypothetical protein|nr:hypothetical protein DK28_0211045 [Peptococcaceae bacterium SCADC1_2_3]KFI34322.1 hypothetical protein HY00_03655 [Peptococcaceae bacterium SCADC1_2_3]KFI36493.1 hypothetical protein HX99_04060 [Peptococcaceae bacterium SCADC1_2_3]HBQ28356.1 hypothetical protein [Desulfotomaculum sp.]HCJ78832.1 hypothetical protein [Desulfotomaculum sp.]